MDPQYPSEFLHAVEGVLQDEGGHVWNPDDPGGETKFGISKREYPNLDIANLSRDQAIAIYWRDWWQRYGFDRLHDAAVAAKVFNLAVNIGPGPAIRCLQRALRAFDLILVEDGILGRNTTGAANFLSPAEALLIGLKCEAAGYYRQLAAERGAAGQEFLDGWLNRAYE